MTLSIDLTAKDRDLIARALKTEAHRWRMAAEARAKSPSEAAPVAEAADKANHFSRLEEVVRGWHRQTSAATPPPEDQT